MFPTLAITAATIGLVTIVALIYREVGAEQAASEKNMLFGAAAVTVAVGVWQAIAHLPSGAAH